MSIFNEFPYANFHEMNLDWILAKVKELAAEWLSYKENMELWKADTEAAFRELKNYVMNYFANLDVDEEISDKLDQMLADGDLNSIIAPAVAEWLEQYITPTTPVIDTSFTISGAGADSKTVGDKTHWYRGRLSSGLMSDCKSNGWWVVRESVTNNNRLVVDGSVNLILCDGATLTAPQGITVTDGKTLTIWRQTEGTGAIIINIAENGIKCAGIGEDEDNYLGTIIINGGNITATGGGAGITAVKQEGWQGE